jgi:hypothetical protein
LTAGAKDEGLKSQNPIQKGVSQEYGFDGNVQISNHHKATLNNQDL